MREQVLANISDSHDRYFRLPYVRSVLMHHMKKGSMDPNVPVDGFTCIHYHGENIQKQMEVIPGQLAILMDQERHQESISKTSLTLLGLDTFHLNYEISAEEFHGLWNALSSLVAQQ